MEGVRGARAMTALTGDPGRISPSSGPGLTHSGMTIEAAGDGSRILNDSEGAFGRGGALGGMADGAGSMPGRGVPRDAVFEESIVEAADGSDGLHARAERPFEQSFNASGLRGDAARIPPGAGA
jgi:hypothetical protein